MEKQILIKQRMYGSVRTVLSKYSQVWANVLPFKTNVDFFEESYGKMEEKELDQNSSKAATKGKKQMLNEMLDNALVVCGGGYAYASIIKDKKLAVPFNFTKSKLGAGKDKEICDRCQKIADTAATIKDKLADFNVSAAQLTQFNDAVKNYYDIINTPRETRKSSKASKEEMLILIDECDRILEEIIDKLMLTFKASQHDFFLEYTNARIIGGSKHKKEKATATA